MPADCAADHLSTHRSPDSKRVPDFFTFASSLQVAAKYEMLAIQSRMFDLVRDAYPETFEGLIPHKPLGESVFSGPAPHPNEVLNLFVQQNFTSALPMAYYMTARRGLNSLMGGHLPASARLSSEILQTAVRGLMVLRERELNGTHRVIFGPKGSYTCSTSTCPSHGQAGLVTFVIYQRIFDHITGSSQSGTRVLQVPEFYRGRVRDNTRDWHPGICSNCVERWVLGHEELRKKVWTSLPDVFGLRG